MRKRPQHVEEARMAGDVEALRAMGRAGARAANSARQRERDVREVLAERRKKEREKEIEDMISSRGGDPED